MDGDASVDGRGREYVPHQRYDLIPPIGEGPHEVLSEKAGSPCDQKSYHEIPSTSAPTGQWVRLPHGQMPAQWMVGRSGSPQKQTWRENAQSTRRTRAERKPNGRSLRVSIVALSFCQIVVGPERVVMASPVVLLCRIAVSRRSLPRRARSRRLRQRNG